MPAFVVREATGSQYATVGRGTRYVAHVAVLARQQLVRFNESVEVFHACPPLWVGQSSTGGDDDRCRLIKANALGWPIELDEDVASEISIFMASVRKRTPDWAPLDSTLEGIEDTYIIHPRMKRVHDRSEVHLRFSCVGFVLYCYEHGGGIPPLIIDDDRLMPEVSLSELKAIYGRMIDRLESDDKLRGVLGLSGAGPWPVCLPGYLLHALTEPRVVPMVPSKEQAVFDVAQSRPPADPTDD